MSKALNILYKKGLKNQNIVYFHIHKVWGVIKCVYFYIALLLLLNN